MKIPGTHMKAQIDTHTCTRTVSLAWPWRHVPTRCLFQSAIVSFQLFWMLSRWIWLHQTVFKHQFLFWSENLCAAASEHFMFKSSQLFRALVNVTFYKLNNHSTLQYEFQVKAGWQQKPQKSFKITEKTSQKTYRRTLVSRRMFLISFCVHGFYCPAV